MLMQTVTTHTMYGPNSASLFIVFQLLVVILEKIQSCESLYAPLPLILIEESFRCVTPTSIQTVVRKTNEDQLRVGTKFSRVLSAGDQITLCAVKIDIYESSNYKEEVNPDNENCAYPIKFDLNEVLKCAHQPEPFIRELVNETWTEDKRNYEFKYVPCGPDRKGRMYTFAYKICITQYPIESRKLGAVSFPRHIPHKMKNKETEFEVFKFCYYHESKQILHTVHEIMSPKLLFDDRLKKEREVTYETMLDSRNYFGFNLDSMKKTYDNYENDDNSSETSKYKFQKMVSPDDFAFALWRKPTYFILNMKKMRVDLIPLWNHIGELIRKAAVEQDEQYHIHTSVYRIHQGQLQTLEKGSQVPDIWLKEIFIPIIRRKDKETYEAIAIYMNQNFDNDSIGNPLIQKCPENLCKDAFTQQFPQVGESIRCCSVHNDYETGRTDKRIVKNLNVEFLGTCNDN